MRLHISRQILTSYVIMRGGSWLGHLPLLCMASCCDDDDNDDDCRFVATAADATVIHTTLCQPPATRLGWPVGHWPTAHSRTDGRQSTRAEQMKNGLVPRWLFHWLQTSSGIAARQIVVMATRRRRLSASLLLLLVTVLVLMDVHHESTFSAAIAHNFTDLNQTDVAH